MPPSAGSPFCGPGTLFEAVASRPSAQARSRGQPAAAAHVHAFTWMTPTDGCAVFSGALLYGRISASRIGPPCHGVRGAVLVTHPVCSFIHPEL